MSLAPLPQEPSSDPGQVPVEPELTWLDEDHALEPVDWADPAEAGTDHPLVVDAAGRMWRLRYRPAWVRRLAAASRLVRSVLA